MKKILQIIAFLALGLPLFGQANTTATATNIRKAGILLPSGKLCFQATDSNDLNISFQLSGGGQAVIAPYCVAISNGGGTLQVPNPAQTTPANINYRVTISDNVNQVLKYTNVQFTGATFNLDTYVPSSNLPFGASVSLLSIGTGFIQNFLDVTEIVNPGNPVAGERWYADLSTHKLSCLTPSGSSCNPSGGGGGSGTWDAITAPVANQALAMLHFTTTWTYDAATGASTNMFVITDTTNNTGTGYLHLIKTASGSAAKPVGFCVKGTTDCVELTSSAIFHPIGAAHINADQVNGVTMASTGSGTLGRIPIDQGNGTSVWADPLVQGTQADLSTGTANPVAIGGYDLAGTPALHRAIELNANPAGTEYGIVTRPIPSGTQAISAASLPLPAGASTAAKQPALGTAGSASADVLSVQGIASMTPLKVDGSAVTQPVSGTVTTAPPANASTNVAQLAGTATSVNSGTKDAGTLRVVLATDQPALTNVLKVDGSAVTQPVSAASLPLPTGAALDATLTGGSLKSINRGGQKGTTSTNADITHTPSGANHELLDIGMYDGSGNQIGLSATPVRVDPTGTTTQPISAASLPLPTGAALDASVTSLEVAQASTTSGQKGILGLGAVTTAAPSYTTAQTSPLSLDLTGNLRTAVTNTVAENQTQINGSAIVTSATGVQKVGIVGNAGAVVDFAGQNAASPANAILAGCQFNTTPTTLTTGNASPCQIDSSGNLKVNIIAGGGTGGGPADVGVTTAASETDAARQKVTAALRLLDTAQGAGSQLVGAKGDQTSGMWVNCKSGCAAAGDQSTGSTALGSNGAVITLPLTGENKATFQLQSGGTGVYTVTPQCSFDNGTLYNVNGVIQDPLSGQISSTAVIASAQATTDYPVLCPQGASNAQMKVTAYTSGTANWVARATVNSGPNLMFGAVQTAAPAPSNNTFNPLSLTTAGALRIDGSGVTQPISAASLPLPTGASTSAKQPALGTAGSASADVITIQGIASMTAIKVDGSAVTQPVSGTVTANQGGTWTVQPGNTANTTAWKVDGSAVTQPVSGTVTVNIGTSGSLALDASVTGLEVAQASTTSGQKGVVVQGAVTTNAPTYTTAQTDPISLDTAGLLRVSVKDTPQNTIAFKVDGSAVTQPISAASLPLPTGASTSAKQPALGTAGSASADVITIQGIASMTAIKVDGSAVTQPVSGTVTTTPPANASTNVTQFGGTNVSTGTGVGGAGIPRVTVSSDSSLTANIGTTNGLALDATLTGGTAKSIIRGGTKGTTSPADITSSASGANHQPVDVAIYDALGNQITSFGGGTEYAENTTQATATGTVALGKNASNVVFPLQLDPNKNLLIGGGSTAGSLLSASENPVLSSGSDNGWGPGVSPGAAPTKRTDYVDIYGRQHVVCDGGCGSSLTVNAGINKLPALPIAGTFGRPVQSTNDALNVYTTNYVDPCSGRKISIPFSQAASSVVVPGGPGRIAVCAVMLNASDAENISWVEGSGVTCGTNTLAVVGGTTAANGNNLAANQGYAWGDGLGKIFDTQIQGNTLCILQSGSGRVSGVLSFAYVSSNVQ